MKYCCDQGKEAFDGEIIYFDEKKNIWGLQDYDGEYNDWFDVHLMVGIHYCPFCGQQLKP